MTYRQMALACPGCGEVLEPKLVDEATIDVCPGCGGVWVDWFDGDLTAMVRGAPPQARGIARGQAGSSACPRCNTPLAAERYRKVGAEIRRCGECAGAFVPHDAAQVIAGVDPDREDRLPMDDPWSRLAAVLKRWFGWEETPSQ